MANEYLQRTPTSTGNRKVWTWSGWVKRNTPTGTRQALFAVTNNVGTIFTGLEFDTNEKLQWYEITLTSGDTVVNTSQVFRDTGNWMHILVVFNSTASSSQDRAKIYVNGTLITSFTTDSRANININTESQINGITYPSYIGSWAVAAPTLYSRAEYTDIFFIDGQALTPDVFGFNKSGKGYISAGSTQSTDFRPGQWVPKTPRVIKTAINNSGGFGVNGFYLPMNDSNNFGADFHCEPNSIIKLQENLPQPRCRIDGVGDYTGALRDDPYAANLVLALPFVFGGLSSGFGDYSAAIRGSGSPKTLTNSNVSIATTASYYGSAGSFNGSNSFMTASMGSDLSFGTDDFTIEFWAYVLNNSSNAYIFDTNVNGMVIGYGNPIGSPSLNRWRYYNGSNGSWTLYTSNPEPVLNQWTHISLCRNKGRTTFYVNGVATSAELDSTNYTNVNSSTLNIGRYGAGGNIHNGYLQELRIYKGVAKYTGGFDVPRPYTPVGIATWRAVPDTTANNFATMNPLIGATPRSGGTITSTIVTYTDGNLTTRNSANGGYAPAMQSHSNVGMTTGKWYWEASNFSTTSNEFFGISKGNEIVTPSGGGTGIECLLAYSSSSGTLVLSTQYDGNSRISATLNNSPGTGISSTSDVIGFAFDVTNSSLSVYRNGVSNNTATGIAATSNVREWFVTKAASSSGTGSGMSWNFGQNPTFSGNTTAGTYTDSNNKGLFKYQPPSGFLALCEDNLPTPAISDPGKYFKTVLYTGDGASGRSIVGVGFTPDLVWIKARTIAYNHRVFDSVRGAGKDNFLMPNLTVAEGDSGNYYGGISSFNADGFSMVYGTGGSNIGINASGENYVAWCWKAGAGTTSTNTNGSITSVVSVNQDAGFSIVSYTGTGANATVGHGLGKVPKMVIIKQRSLSGYSWVVYHSGLTNANYYVALESTIGQTSVPALFNSTAPTSSVFSVGTETAVSGNGNTFIAYCWAEIEGFSKFGSYVGNNSTDGPFCYCGFRPAWVMIKSSSASVGNWLIMDNARNSTNPVDLDLYANLTNIESQYARFDYISNGFKVRNTSSEMNGSGVTYIFVAFAESPFQTANAK